MEGKKGRKYEKDFSFEGLHSGDHSTLISEAFTLPSCQFSDACFSLDIAKSTPVKENRNQANWNHSDHHQPIFTGSVHAERHQYVADTKQTVQKSQVTGNGNFTRELSLAPATGIGSNVWSELAQDNKSRKYIGTNNNANQTITKDVNSKRPFWSKLLMCS